MQYDLGTRIKKSLKLAKEQLMKKEWIKPEAEFVASVADAQVGTGGGPS